MRRCPHCQSPHPTQAAFCPGCGRALPPALREAWLQWGDLWDRRALRRTLLGLLPLVAFRLSCGDLLTAGPFRDESRFLAFHCGHGLLLAAGLAWAREERGVRAWAGWLLAGLAGGFLAEGLELWFSYRQIFSGLAVWVWVQFGLKDRPELVYQMLQSLRLLGVALPLWARTLAVEARPARWLQAPLWLALAVWLRKDVRGAFLHWGLLWDGWGPAWTALGLYGASTLALGWGLGPRAPKGLPGRPALSR